jgi:threonine dehydrogenase-like Zn-dependent dehydrogenase
MSETQTAAVLPSFTEPLKLETVPIPTPSTGSITVKVLALYVLPYAAKVFDGSIGYNFPLPMTPGGSCVGRIHSIGPDTTIFQPGQLVLCDPTIRARDDASTSILMGITQGFSAGGAKLMSGPWRNGSFAEYVMMPLENVFALDEKRLCEELGYRIVDLPQLQTCMIPFGGIDDAGVRPGDTVIVAPATGKFGGAAVLMALARGATVVAVGRNADALERLRASTESYGAMLKTVRVTGDGEADTQTLADSLGPRGADSYIDFSPNAAAAGGQTPSHITLCLNSLRPKGTAVFMGGIFGNVELPYLTMMFKSLVVRGRFMYERHQAEQVIKMAESGVLRVGKSLRAENQIFKLQQVLEAVDAAAGSAGWGKNVVIMP